MAQRGRKSAASLSAVTAIPGQRVLPPRELTEEQAEEWRAIVATKPAEWFNRDSQALLVDLCRHIVIARRVAEQIDSFPADHLPTEEGLTRYKKLGAMADRHSRVISVLASKMRLAPSSRYDAKTANTAASRADASGSSRPWDLS
jgi:hypothetical protein